MRAHLKGIFPAVASPCDDQDMFLEDRFAALVADLYRAGVNGLYVCGGTGDGYRMRLEERKRAAQIALDLSERTHGRVIVHVGTTNSRDAIELATHAAASGAAAISSMPPPGADLGELRNYYSEIARAAGIPVLIYHLPSRATAVPTLDQLLALLDIEGVVGLKLSDWNLFFMRRLRLARPELVIFNGFDEFLYPGLLYGAQGGIGMWYNLFPRLFVGVYAAVQAADHAKAIALQDCLLSFLDLAWRYGLEPVFELLMNRRGYGPHCFRRPRPEVPPEVRGQMERELEARVAAVEAAA